MDSPCGEADVLSDLIVQLPQAKSATETFSLFTSKLQALFEGLQHVSLLLLPAEAGTGGSSGHAAAASAPLPGGGKGAGKSSKAGAGAAGAAGHKAAAAAASSSAGGDPQASSKLQQGFVTPGPTLDWSNCCVFQLSSGRGPVVQAAPSWPVACTATCYAALTVRDVVVTGDFSARGPHFLDWKALAERGCVSMAALPMFSCNRPVAVLCLASIKPDAFAAVATLKLLAGLLAPYCSLLTYRTRVTEMRRLVNEIITPIAAQLAQQKQCVLLNKLGCTVEEAPPGTVPADGKGISVAVGGHGRGSSGSGSHAAGAAAAAGSVGVVTAPTPVLPISGSSNNSSGSSLRQRKGGSSAKGSAGSSKGGSSKAINGTAAAPVAARAWPVADAGSGQQQGLSHKRFESVVVKGSGVSGYDSDGFGGSGAADMDCWSDFCFNLVSMALVWVFFNKNAAGESMIAVLLCMGVAAFDIVLLVMRWLWFEQYINHGGAVMSLFSAYRVLVLPIANTWMSWSLLHKLSWTPSGPLIALLGVILVGCIIMGLQVRFFLHAPLQLASVLFAALSTPNICGAVFESTNNIRCIGLVSALQVSLGLVVPSLCVWLLEGRSGPGRQFLPHAQVKPQLKYTFSALAHQ